MPDPVRIDPQAVIGYLEKQGFTSRQVRYWRVLNKPGVVCTAVIPTHSPLFPDQVELILRNAEVPEAEILRLIATWSVTDPPYPSV